MESLSNQYILHPPLERNTTSRGWAIKTGEHGLASTSIEIPGCVILNLTLAIREPQQKPRKQQKQLRFYNKFRITIIYTNNW